MKEEKCKESGKKMMGNRKDRRKQCILVLLPKKLCTDTIQRLKKKIPLFFPCRGQLGKLKLENAVPSSDFGHNNNYYFPLII